MSIPSIEEMHLYTEYRYPHCVYALMWGKSIIYIGQTRDLQRRISEHRRTKVFDEVRYWPVHSDQADRIERELIEQHQPQYNQIYHADPQAPLYCQGYQCDKYVEDPGDALCGECAMI